MNDSLNSNPAERLPNPTFDTPVLLVDDDDVLPPVIARLSQSRALGVDLESDSFHHYFNKPCLLQISSETEDIVIDPLKIKDLSPLQEIFNNPSIEKVFHAADNDLHHLRRDLNIEVSGLFDTQIAAQIAGHRRFGLSDLIGHYISFQLDKRLQLHNWANRPLLESHLNYARADTHFLLELRALLWEKLQQRQRTEHAWEEFRIAESKRREEKEAQPDEFMKLLHGSQEEIPTLLVLRELYHWRDEMAKHRDVAPFRTVPNDMLVLLAQRRPVTLDELVALPHFPTRLAQRYGRALITTILAGLRSKSPLPRPARPERKMRPPADYDAVLKGLKQWRTDAALRLDLDPSVLAPNATLIQLARLKPASLDMLQDVAEVRRWQVNEFGHEWLTLVNGGESLQIRPS